MGKSLRKRLLFWRQKDKEPEDVSHHFHGRQCISGCEHYSSLAQRPLLKAIVFEWMKRNLGIRTVGEIATALDIHFTVPLREALEDLEAEGKITMERRHSMVSLGWSSAGISVDDWLKQTAVEQEGVE